MSALGGSKNKGLSLQRVREDSLQCKRERTRIMGVVDTINRRKGQKCRNENVQLNPLLLGAVCAKFPHPSATIQTARCVLFSCACDPKLTVAPTTFAPPSLQTPFWEDGRERLLQFETFVRWVVLCHNGALPTFIQELNKRYLWAGLL